MSTPVPLSTKISVPEIRSNYPLPEGQARAIHAARPAPTAELKMLAKIIEGW